MFTRLSPIRRAWPILAAVLLLATACAGPPTASPTPGPSGPEPPSVAAPTPQPLAAASAPETAAPPATETTGSTVPPPATVTTGPVAAPTARPTSPPATEVWLQVAAGQGANLRAEPSVTATRLKTLGAGAPVLVVGPNSESDGQAWRNVRDTEGTSGWVAAELLMQPGTAPPAVVAEAAGPPPPPAWRAAGLPGRSVEEQPRTGVPSETAPASPADAVPGQQTVRFLVRTIT